MVILGKTLILFYAIAEIIQILHWYAILVGNFFIRVFPTPQEVMKPQKSILGDYEFFLLPSVTRLRDIMGKTIFIMLSGRLKAISQATCGILYSHDCVAISLMLNNVYFD